jgi:hypothetical protein
MRIRNVHERNVGDAGAAIERIEEVWPADRWTQLRLDRPLGVGARTGRAVVREEVIDYRPHERLVFRITEPKGLVATHQFDADDGVLRHVVEGEVHGWMRLGWPPLVRPLHDALLEDLLDRAEGRATYTHPYSPRVRFLRWGFRKLRRRRFERTRA